MSRFTFEYDLFSDLYKDAHGFRPRYHEFYEDDTTDERRQEIWDYTCEVLEETIAQEREHEQRCLRDFEALVEQTIELGAGDEETALRWLTSSEEFYSGQCVEHWVWEKGILFTDYGRKLVDRLLNIVKFKEMEYA
jgi:hypothetical protein